MALVLLRLACLTQRDVFTLSPSGLGGGWTAGPRPGQADRGLCSVGRHMVLGERAASCTAPSLTAVPEEEQQGSP